MTKTEIEWATDVWNPTAGCDRVSPGCDNCYALTMAKRLKGMGQAKYQLDGDPRTSGPGFLAHEWPQALDWPLTVKKPMRVFVNSMSDLFHANISDEFIARVFAVMAVAPQHTFMVLTKRHARMRSLLTSNDFAYAVGLHMAEYDLLAPSVGWPIPNVMLGVSVEDQHWADIRIPTLLDTPAAVRFLSCEPLLGPLDLGGWAVSPDEGYTVGLPFDWVIVGGESGPGARPMHPDWARSLRDQCVCAEPTVPFMFKQWGAWRPTRGDDPLTKRAVFTFADGRTVRRVGKHTAGRELDGRTWDEFPAVAQ